MVQLALGVRTQTYAQCTKKGSNMFTTVVFPHARTGGEIVAAFRAAASWQTGPTCRWQAHTFGVSAARIYPTNTWEGPVGVKATRAWKKPHNKISQRLFDTSEERWRTYPLKLGSGVVPPPHGEFGVQITLSPLYRSHEYAEVQVMAYVTFLDEPGSLGAFMNWASHIDCKEFQSLRPEYDKILQNFYSRCVG